MSAGLPTPPRAAAGSSAGADTNPSPGATRSAHQDEVPREDRSTAEESGGSGEASGGEGRRERWRPSPQLGRGEILWAILAGVALAVITTWPLVLHLPSRIAPDLGDPVRTAWEVAWVGHAMLHQPLHLFDSNAFYPHPLSLAFSDSLLGYGPAAWFGSGTVAALVRYNLLFLFAWSLCFVGAYLLARELGLRKLAAGAAGAAFAYAPYRVTEAGHLHVISSGGVALSLFLLLRGYRRRSRGLLVAGWLVAAWQISLGFTLGLQFTYLFALLGLLAAVYWWRAGRPALPRALVGITCIGIAVVGVVAIYQARPYLKISHDYPTAKRTIREVKTYSAGPAAWISASSENRVWGDLTAGARAHVHSKNEQVLFPGGLLLLLALIGLTTPLYTRRLRLGLALGAITCAVFALGLGLTGAGYPYRLLFDYAPGWDGVRVPGRVFTLATLFLALLAGAGAQMLAGWIGGFASRHGGSWTARRPLALSATVGVVIVIGLVGEGAGHLAHPVVPQPQAAEVGLPGPRLDMPTDGPADRIWQYFSTDGFYKIPIGNSTFDIPAIDDLRGGIHRFPDKGSVEKLRYYGIRTVVLHLTMPTLPGIHSFAHAEPPDSAAAAAKPIAGLGMTRRRVGSLVIYEIGPGPKALHGSD